MTPTELRETMLADLLVYGRKRGVAWRTTPSADDISRMSPQEVSDAFKADIAAYGRKHGIEFDPPSADVTVSEVMTSQTLFHEGVTLEVDLTPPWWCNGIEYLRAAATALLEQEDDIGHSVEFTIGINRVTMRLCWPAATSAKDIDQWRSRMIARIEAQPGMAERKAQWTEWHNERYGTPEEREARRLRTLEQIRARETAASA